MYVCIYIIMQELLQQDFRLHECRLNACPWSLPNYCYQVRVYVCMHACIYICICDFVVPMGLTQLLLPGSSVCMYVCMHIHMYL